MRARIASILRRNDPEWGELWGGILLACFGSWLLMPWLTWVAYTVDGCRAGAYEFVANFWPNENWQGVTFVLAGSAHMLAAVQQWRPAPRILIAAFGAVLWTLTTISFGLWQWRSTATPIYGLCVVGQLGLLYRHWVEIQVQRALNGR